MAPTSDDTTRHLRVLAALVTQRRVALGITDKRVAAKRCGMSVTTYSKIETQAVRVVDATYAKLESGFGILSGECKAVLDGADSIKLLDGTELIAGAHIVRHQVSAEELGDELRDGVIEVATATIPQVSLGDARELSERVAAYALEVLRGRGLLDESE